MANNNADHPGGDARFAFGDNWRKFSYEIDERRVQRAAESLCAQLGRDTLKGKNFLDAGCGSGLFSLAAVRAGAARVVSFDYDPESVAAAAAVKRRFCPEADHWSIGRGDVLDLKYLQSLGTFDIVYSWGVLHHTGDLWQAIDRVAESCAPGGTLFIAIYNDQGVFSALWKGIKQTYNALPGPLKYLVLLPVFARLWGPSIVRDFAALHPFKRWNEYAENRGMSPWRDVVDWVGGYPFEVASREKVTSRVERKHFRLRTITSCGKGHGNNEFVFVKDA